MQDNPAGASPICGPAALTNLIRKKETYSTAERRSSPLYEPPRHCVAGNSAVHLSLFNSRSSYEELSDDYRSHEESESTSDSDKSGGDIMSNPVSLFPQFYPPDKETSEEKKASSQRTQNRPRTSSWSSTLAAVTEETSFDDTSLHSRDTSSEQLPHATAEKSVVDPAQPQQERTYETPPEKKEMLTAMRNLILKQQHALTELSEQNTQYRKKIGDYQSKLIEMKQDAVNQQARIDQLELEKEASVAECLWQREELRALRLDKETILSDKKGDQTEMDCSANTEFPEEDEEEEEEEEEEHGDEDDSLQVRFRDLMMPFAESPASSRQTCVPESPVSAAPTNDERSTWEDERSTWEDDIPVPECKADQRMLEAAPPEENQESEQAADENASSPFRDRTIGSANTSMGNPILTNHSSSSETISETSKGTAPTTSSSWSLGLPSRSREEAREEMAEFKRRLQTVQKKRSERRVVQQYSKPVVRFGLLGT